MDQANLEQYRRKLSDMRNRTRTEINRMIEVVLEDARPAGEHDRGTSESVDKEIALESTEERMRSAITAALERVENGTYGQCQECGCEIAEARLDAIPYAAYCIECERKREDDERQ